MGLLAFGDTSGLVFVGVGFYTTFNSCNGWLGLVMGYRRASTPLLELMARTLVLWVFLHGVQHFVGVIELVEFDIGDCRVFYCHLRSTGSMLATGRMASGNGLGLREAGMNRCLLQGVISHDMQSM